MNELITIEGVRGFIDNNGVAQLNLEDVSRGLGFTRVAESGNVVVRWDRVTEYLEEYNVPTSGHDLKILCIPENVFYKLAFRASNETARKFQDLVCDKILPQIRKTGGYIPTNSQDTDESIMAKAFLIANRTIESQNKQLKQSEAKLLEASQQIEVKNEVIETQKETIEILTGRALQLKDRTLLVLLVNDLNNLRKFEFQTIYRSIYDLIRNQLHMDLTMRQKNRKSKTKIETISNEEWLKVVPLMVAWYLDKGGDSERLSLILNHGLAA